MNNIFIDLVTIDGQIIRIEAEERHSDEIYESIEHARNRGDWWSPYQFDGCNVEFMGMRMSRIDMKKIIGML